MKLYQFLWCSFFIMLVFSCQNTTTTNDVSIDGKWESEAITTSIEEVGKVKIAFDFSDSLCLFQPFHQDFTPFDLEDSKITIRTENDYDKEYVFKITEQTDTSMILEAGNVLTLMTLEFFEFGELSKIPLKKLGVD